MQNLMVLRGRIKESVMFLMPHFFLINLFILLYSTTLVARKVQTEKKPALGAGKSANSANFGHSPSANLTDCIENCRNSQHLCSIQINSDSDWNCAHDSLKCRKQCKTMWGSSQSNKRDKKAGHRARRKKR